jgi:hypothetical protein
VIPEHLVRGVPLAGLTAPGHLRTEGAFDLIAASEEVNRVAFGTMSVNLTRKLQAVGHPDAHFSLH